ncbi:hypothetical protein L6V77_13505 [Myxococcota bacterium]|nr:hypothetical protein [Myxococcota bacterium]
MSARRPAAPPPEPGTDTDADADDSAARAFFESGDDPPPVVPQHSFLRLGLLVAVFVMAVALMARLSAGATFLLFHGRTVECGDIGTRAGAAAPLEPFEHGTWCHLKGVVAYPTLVATGQENTAASSLSERHRGQKFISQLEGDRIFLIVDGGRVDVVNHRVEFGNLYGFHIEEEGRIIDPDVDPRFAEVGPTLRSRFRIPTSDPIRLFDTTDEPLSNWFVGLALVVVVFIAVRSIYSAAVLLREVREGRRTRRALDDAAP